MTIFAAAAGVVVIVIGAAVVAWWLNLRRRYRWLAGGGDWEIRAFNNFVQLAAIQPYATALWTEIDFDALTICHGESNVAFGAIHDASSSTK